MPSNNLAPANSSALNYGTVTKTPLNLAQVTGNSQPNTPALNYGTAVKTPLNLAQVTGNSQPNTQALVWTPPQPIAQPLSTEPVKTPTVITPQASKNRINDINSTMSYMTTPQVPPQPQQTTQAQPNQDQTQATQPTLSPIDKQIAEASEPTTPAPVDENKQKMDEIQKQQVDISSKIDSIGKDLTDYINKIKTGQTALPYTSEEQQIISATQANLDSQKQLLVKQLTATQGQASEYLAQRGISRRSPLEAAMYTQQIAGESAAKLAMYDATSVKTMAELRKSIQDGKVAEMEKAYSQLYDVYKARSDELQKTSDAIAKITADQQAAVIKKQEQDTTAKQDLLKTILESGLSPDEKNQAALAVFTASDPMAAYVAVAGMIPQKTTGVTGSIQEYQYAVSQGYKGTYEQYQNEDANRKAKASGSGNSMSQYQVMSRMDRINNQYDNEPIVRNFNTVAEGYNKMLSIPENSTSGSEQQSLIYALSKINDPTSAVRETEYDTAKRYAMGELGMTAQDAERVLTGGTAFLTSQAIKRIKEAGKKIYQSQKGLYEEKTKQYQEQMQAAASGQAPSLRDYSTTVKATSNAEGNNGSGGGDGYNGLPSYAPSGTVATDNDGYTYKSDGSSWIPQ